MIRRAEPGDPRLARAPGDPLLSAAIQGEALAGGGGAPGEFWLVLGEGEEPEGAVCRTGGLVRATVAREEAAPEAAEFLAFLGWGWLETDGFLAPRLPGKARRLPELEYRGPLPEAPACPEPQEPPVGEVIGCCCAAGALDPGAAEGHYLHLHRLVRRGAARVFLLPGPGGEPAACAALTHLGESRAVIGYLACRPEHRGRGLGGAALRAAVRAAMEAGKTPVLACREELEPYHLARGFRRAGRLWEFPAPGEGETT